MKTLCIYGCGGMGREIADLSARINKWQRLVFVDDNIVNRIVDDIEVYTFSEIQEKFCSNDLEFIVTTGEPLYRKNLYNKIKEHNFTCVSVISPEFILSKSSSVKDGTIIHTGAVATCNVHIGLGCLINKHSVIGHDVSIGDYSVVSPNVTIGGEVTVGESCYIASGAIIRNGIKIGDNAIIGMGSVVLKDVEPGHVMVGNPARFLRENSEGKVFKQSNKRV